MVLFVAHDGGPSQQLLHYGPRPDRSLDEELDEARLERRICNAERAILEFVRAKSQSDEGCASVVRRAFDAIDVAGDHLLGPGAFIEALRRCGLGGLDHDPAVLDGLFRKHASPAHGGFVVCEEFWPNLVRNVQRVGSARVVQRHTDRIEAAGAAAARLAAEKSAAPTQAEGGLRMPGTAPHQQPSSRHEDAYYAELEAEVERRIASMRNRAAYTDEIREGVERGLMEREARVPHKAAPGRGRGVSEKSAPPRFGFGQGERFARPELSSTPGPGAYDAAW